MEPHKVLLLEGGKRPSRQTRQELESKGFTVVEVTDLEGCVQTLQSDPDYTVVIDLDLQRKGVEALEEIRRVSAEAVVIVIASLERLSVVDEALKGGAWDFVIKQPDLSHLQELPQAIRRNAELKGLRAGLGRSQVETGWWRQALEESQEGLFVANSHEEILFANSALALLLGCDRQTLVGRKLETVLSLPSPDDSSWKEVQDFPPRRNWEGEAVLRKADGAELAATVRVTRLLDPEGNTSTLVGSCRPPEEKKFSPILELGLDEVREVILADISEDLTSPLAAMMGYLEIASALSPNQGAEPNQILAVQRIHALATRLQNLVNSHTSALEIEANKFPIHRSPLELHQILDLAVESRKGEAGAKNIEISMEADSALPLISGDGVQMERAFGILISNAIALSPLGGSVVVRSGLRGGEVAVTIKDSGAGIPPEDIPLLFQRRGRLRRRGGDISTVGLFVARHVVTAHEGRIEVDSDPMEGTTLTVLLPA